MAGVVGVAAAADTPPAPRVATAAPAGVESPGSAAVAASLAPAQPPALPRTGLAAADLAVLYAAGDATSEAIARAYQRERGLPEANLVGVALPGGSDTISDSDFARLKADLDARLPAGIQATLVTWTSAVAGGRRQLCDGPDQRAGLRLRRLDVRRLQPHQGLGLLRHRHHPALDRPAHPALDDAGRGHAGGRAGADHARPGGRRQRTHRHRLGRAHRRRRAQRALPRLPEPERGLVRRAGPDLPLPGRQRRRQCARAGEPDRPAVLLHRPGQGVAGGEQPLPAGCGGRSPDLVRRLPAGGQGPDAGHRLAGRRRHRQLRHRRRAVQLRREVPARLGADRPLRAWRDGDGGLLEVGRDARPGPVRRRTAGPALGQRAQRHDRGLANW